MSQHSRLCLGHLPIAVLLSLWALAFLHCSSKSSSSALLEKLSSNERWSKAGSVLVSPPIIGRNGDAVVATIKIQKAGLFSSEKTVLQMNLRRMQFPSAASNMTFIGGFANGELNGSLFQAQKVESHSVKLVRNDSGKLVFEGTFSFGSLRIKIPLIEAEEAKSSRDARLRFGNFDGDRVPKYWDLKEIVQGAIQTFTQAQAIPINRVQEAKILTWRISEDSRRFRIQECVLWVRLNNPPQWMLVHVARRRHFQEGWSGWFRAYVSHAKPIWIQAYNHPPTSGEIELFLETNEWWTGPERFTLLDAEVCTNAWKKVTGQKPTNAFK